jgi:pimeloyl-ACP methyl ester carboxylesterase
MHIFCHANGFPPDCYKEFFDHYKNEMNAQLLPITLTPLERQFTMYEAARNWHDYSWDLIRKIEKIEHPVSAVGHSMGGILLLKAAVEKPEYFENLILLDPTILPRRFVYLSNYLPKFITRKIHPVASKAYRRKDTFDSYQAAFDNLREKKLFKFFSDEALWNYVNAGFKETIDGNVSLTFTKRWEEHCFLSVISAWGLLKNVKVPTKIIYGEKSDLIRPIIMKRIKKLNPNIELISSRGGHLFPMEFPRNIPLV